MPPALKERLRNPLREFGREITRCQDTPELKTEGARVVSAELRKLSPKLKLLGVEMVIQITPKPAGAKPVTPPPSAAVSARTAAASEKAAAFDPVLAGLKLVEQMKQAEGGAFTGSELKSLYDLSPAALHSRRAKHGIVFWRDAKHDFHYPKWQFTPAGALIHGLQEVLRIFKSTDEWRIMRYFLAPRQQLNGRTPLDLLRSGNAQEVTEHAKLHHAENSW